MMVTEVMTMAGTFYGLVKGIAQRIAFVIVLIAGLMWWAFR